MSHKILHALDSFDSSILPHLFSSSHWLHQQEHQQVPAPAPSHIQHGLPEEVAPATTVAQLPYSHLLLFLDYDGTLTPIVSRPDLAVLSPEMSDLLHTLAAMDSPRHVIPTLKSSTQQIHLHQQKQQQQQLLIHTAIVSGRSAANVKEMIYEKGRSHVSFQPLQPQPITPTTTSAMKTTATATVTQQRQQLQLQLRQDLYIAGNHGFEIEGPKLKHQVNLAEAYVPDMQRVAAELQSKLGDIKGCIIENKTLSLSVHYRMVTPPQQQGEEGEETSQAKSGTTGVMATETTARPLIKRIFDTVDAIALREAERIKLTYGKKVIEVRPRIEWNKGKAVLHLYNLIAKQLNQEYSESKQSGSSQAQKTHIFAMYIGDDKTDEDAFLALKENNLGIGVLVAESSALNDPRIRNGTTEATHYVVGVEQVKLLLQRLVATAKQQQA